MITPHDSLILPTLCGENPIPHQGHIGNVVSKGLTVADEADFFSVNYVGS